MSQAWSFTDPPDTAVLTVRRIIEQGSPILLVIHGVDEDGWQFFDGEDIAETDALVASLFHMVTRDASLRSLISLPPGWGAYRRDPSQPWQTYQL
jgi:hypothetical protein